MNSKAKRSLLLLGLPLAFAMATWLAFSFDPFQHFLSVMSISFFLGVPFGIGYLSIHLSPIDSVKNIRYRIFVPWIPILLFLILTIFLRVEGLACWIMILPVFLVCSTLGWLLAGRQKLRQHSRRDKLNISIVALLPFLMVPFEHLIPENAKKYEKFTYIDIYAPAARIWTNVVRVRTISEHEDHGRLAPLLGFPRPVRAELDFAGVGGSRQAIFSKGLIFQEIVREYIDQQRMSFGIKADPSAIPPTTMDKHIIVGGEFFNVLDGTYELVPLSNNAFRLNLYSHFTLKTRFNFYATLWAGWIMKDIQNNILLVIKDRCESH